MKKRVKLILLAVLVLAGAISGVFVWMRPVTVETETIQKGNMERKVTVEAEIVPKFAMILNAPAAGKVMEIPCQAGGEVKAGELLLQTDAVSQTGLDLQKEQLNQQLTAARQEYNRRFGQNGTALSRYETAASEYRLARKKYENGSVLAQEGYLAPADLDELRTLRDLAYQEYLQAKEDNSESSRAYYKSQIESCERQIKVLNESLGPRGIYMPYDGVIWEIYAEPGSYVSENQAAVKVYRPDSMKLRASVLLEDGALLSPGETAEVVFADGTAGQASITFLSKTAAKSLSAVGLSENRRTVELVPGEFPAYSGAGQTADVTFTIVTARDVCTVPASAVVPDGAEDAVYLVRGDRAELTAVETGKREGGRVEILSGVLEGDIVVADPYEYEIKDKSRVKAAAAR